MQNWHRKYSDFAIAFSVHLGPSPSAALLVIPKFNIFVASSEYNDSYTPTKGDDGTELGLSSYRFVEDYPFTQCIKQAFIQKSCSSNLPFLASKKCVVLSLEMSSDSAKTVAVNSNGDVIVVALPSLVILNVFHRYLFSPTMTPTAAVWLNLEEVAVVGREGHVEQMKLTGEEHLFVGSSAAEQFTRCKTVFSDSNGDLLTLRELNLHGGEALAGTALNASLTFLFGWIKFLYSVTFGQTREEVEKKVVFRNELHATRIISLHDYVEKLLSQRRYEEAIELAEKEPEFDIDIIYRRQWKDSRVDVTTELIDVLERVADKAWAVEECLRVTSEDGSIHNRLLNLADSFSSSLPQSTVNRIHNAKFVLDAVTRTDSSTELYLRFRSFSPLDIACSVAREGNVRLLVDILKHADTSVRCCYLVVLSLVPESLQLKKYEKVIPSSFSSKLSRRIFTLSESHDCTHNVTEEMLPTIAKDYSRFIFDPGCNECEIFEEWCQYRVQAIDKCSGLADDCIALLEVAIARGFTGLTGLSKQWRDYRDFTMFCSSVVMSFEQFLKQDISVVRNALRKHMTDIGANILRVVEILEVFGKDQARTEALEIVKTQSRANFNALDAVMTNRPGYFSTSMIIECFTECSATGDELVEAMRRFKLPPDWVKALEICNDAELRPTFSILHDSLETKAFAEQFLKDYVHYAAAKMGDNWAELTRQTFELRDLAFGDVVERRTLQRMIANQMLSWWVESPNAKMPALNGVVDVRSNKPDLLPVSEFVETVIEKSNEYIEMSNTSTDDENLTIAGRVLDVLASLEIAKDQPTVVKQRDLLNVIAKCIVMGSLRPPATYRYCEPDGLLAEVVSVGTNYKQVKTCAEVSKLLGFKTPAARALAYCAAQAFKAKDTSTGHRYIQQLIRTAKGFADIYHVCKDVIPLCEEPSLRLDLITCLTLNAPTEELPVLWELLSTFSPRDAADRRPAEEAQKEALLYSVLNHSALSPTKQL